MIKHERYSASADSLGLLETATNQLLRVQAGFKANLPTALKSERNEAKRLVESYLRELRMDVQKLVNKNRQHAESHCERCQYVYKKFREQ